MGKVYVASPYQGLLDLGYSYDDVRRYANECMRVAEEFLQCDKDELFSPVLAFMDIHRNSPREEVMDLCFEKLEGCDTLFIYDYEAYPQESIIDSQGIFDEYSMARNLDKKVIVKSFDGFLANRFYQRYSHNRGYSPKKAMEVSY